MRKPSGDRGTLAESGAVRKAGGIKVAGMADDARPILTGGVLPGGPEERRHRQRQGVRFHEIASRHHGPSDQTVSGITNGLR